MNMHIKWYINFPSSYIKFTYKPRDLLILYMPLYFGLPTNFFLLLLFLLSISFIFLFYLYIHTYIYTYMFYSSFPFFFFFFFYVLHNLFSLIFAKRGWNSRWKFGHADHVCNYYSRENGYLFNASGVAVSIITSRIF